MSSPFSLFRRHQRVLMVVTTGLAMISFVLLGAISDPRNMPPLLVAILFAAMIGGLFWLAGLSRGKATDWGLSGVVLGVVLGMAMVWSSRESKAVTLEGGGLTGTEVSELVKQRDIANSFVQMAAATSIPEGGDEAAKMQAQFAASQLMRANMFGFMSAEEISTEDVILGEVLRREAKEMGIVISDDVVFKFMQKVSGDDDNTKTKKNLTKSAFAKIRKTLQVSETSLMDILRQEILAREAAKLLSSQTYMTPENQWEFYQKLNVKQSAEIISVPVSSFVTESMQPTDAELQALLDQHRENLPGYTREGRPSEGTPGFFQLPKFQVAYLEAVFDDIQATVGEVTEAEVEERYKKEFVDDVAPELPEEMKAPIETPANPPVLPPKPEEPKPEAPKPGAPKTEAPKTEAPKPEAPKPEAPKPEAPKPEAPKPEAPKPEAPKTEEPKTEEPKTEEPAQSLNEEALSKLQFVAFQDDPAKEEAPKVDPPAEAKPQLEPGKEAAPVKPVTDEKQADEKTSENSAPAAEAPAKTDAKPALTEEKPAEEGTEPAKPEMKAPPLGEEALPPAPMSDVPELTDELKTQIREDILRERTQKKIADLMDAANIFVTGLAGRYSLGSFEQDEYVSLEEATKQIKAYAKEHNLEFIETPYLTLSELSKSEDYPIGSAFLERSQDGGTVAGGLQQSIPSILFKVGRAYRFNFGDTGSSSVSRYIYWKSGYQAEYAPKTIDDEAAVREQVVKVWKQQQADEAARKRAEELAKLVETSGKPMGEALSDETVTGNPDSLFLTVRETGEFTMMTQGTAPATNPFQQQQPQPPRYSTVAGAEDAGERFFNTVFEKIDVEDVGVAPNRDGSIYYVVRIKDRNPSSPETLNAMRKNFLNQGWQAPYYYLGNNLLGQYGKDWRRELLDKYDVQFAAQLAPEDESGEG